MADNVSSFDDDDDQELFYDLLDQSSDLEQLSDDETDDYQQENLDYRTFETTSSKKKASKKALKNDIKWKTGPMMNKKKYEDVETNSSNNKKRPIDYFFEYLPLTFWDDVVKHTNNYDSTLGVCFIEIMKYLALCMATGIYKFPRIRMYWMKDFGIPLFYSNMSRDRFFQIRNALHVTDQKINPTGQDRLRKVRPMYDLILKKCYSLPKETNLCAFRGRINILQYVKNKPNPWGIKVFLLAGASGKVYDFIIYQGSTTEYTEGTVDKFGVGAGTVLHLVQKVQPNYHNLYCDNYFTTYTLMKETSQKGINCAGTARTNRFGKAPLPTDKEMLKMARGSSYEVCDDDGVVGLIKWRDGKCILMASNFVLSGAPDKVTRHNKKEKCLEEVERPEIIKLYNENMGGVDKFNQLMSYYRINHKTKKWTVKMIENAIDMAVVQSYLEYSSVHCNQIDLLEFKMSVIKSLLSWEKWGPRQREKYEKLRLGKAQNKKVSLAKRRISQKQKLKKVKKITKKRTV